MPEIRLDRIEKRFGPTQVLPPLDLTMRDGEFTVLVGPSGCGKSTTLRILAGLEVPTAGEIWFDDRPISKLDPKDRDIAMVFQDYALYPHMTIARNMSFALRLARRPKAEIAETVARVAETLGLSALLDRKPAELSGGQRQRVAMGRALVRDAAVFLFDEPLSNLDAKLRGKMRTELAEMRAGIDKTMVYVTHDQVEAMTLGDRIVVMREGRIEQQGTPEELFRAPVNTFVAGFIGSPAMNLLDGEIDGGMVRGDGFALPLDATAPAHSRSRKVTVGIRPSSFVADPEGGHGLDLRVTISEYLGAQSVLVTRLGRHEVLVETASAHPIAPGATLRFGVAPGETMLFDRTTGLRL